MLFRSGGWRATSGARSTAGEATGVVTKPKGAPGCSGLVPEQLEDVANRAEAAVDGVVEERVVGQRQRDAPQIERVGEFGGEARVVAQWANSFV